MDLFAVVVSSLYGLGVSMFGWQCWQFVAARLDPDVPMDRFERRVLFTFCTVMAILWPVTMPLTAFALICYRMFTEHGTQPEPAHPPNEMTEQEAYAADIEATVR